MVLYAPFQHRLEAALLQTLQSFFLLVDRQRSTIFAFGEPL
ncbi:hypothetical protein NIES2104_10390 [Leptolyngbya sp. NIES-2104]|nr:hypothetical protein NIES2104_10390 [Leptolyngbya sp. NIES-2104]